MQTLEISYKNHKGAKAIYLEDNRGDHFIVCPLELSKVLRNADNDNRLNLCQISYEGNLIADTFMDIHPEGPIMIIDIRKADEMMIRQCIITRQQFLTMAQNALQVLALTTLGKRRCETVLAMAI